MPSPWVTPEYRTPVASFTIWISAPAMARPEGSSTKPLIVPKGDCAIAAVARNTIQNRNWKGRGRLTRAAPGVNGFITIHPVYGSPLVFVSIFVRPAVAEQPVVGFPNT